MASLRDDPAEHAPPRSIVMEYLTGRAHYELVLRDGLANAKVSVWIATANLKELLIEAPRGTRAHRQGQYRSVMELFAELADRGVELRILHAGLPSQAFARELVRHRRLLRPSAPGRTAPLELRRCPRVHLKTVVLDGGRAYLGSANWTGAGLGAKGAGRRNFEVGFMTEDHLVLDDVQGLYESIWTGSHCGRCQLRDRCPAPLDEVSSVG